jgi:outer membrane protein TolC
MRDFHVHTLSARALRRPLLAAVAALLSAASPRAGAQTTTPEPRVITLPEAIAIAERQGLAAAAARDSRDAARWRDRAFSARLLPQLSFGGEAVNLDRSINPILQDDGTTLLLRQQRTVSGIGMTVAQPLPWSGTELTMSSQVARYDVLDADNVTHRFWQTQPVVLGIRQSIFRPRTRLWEMRQQDIAASIAERQYLETREDNAATTATAFFDYYAATVALANATANAAVNDTLYTLNTGRFEVGKIGENDLLQSELALLRSRTSLDGAKLERDRTEAALRRLLNLPPDQRIEVVPPKEVPPIQADPDTAAEQALHNASAIEQIELEGVLAKRRISEARLNNGFGATINAEVGVNQTAAQFGAAYDAPLPKQRVTLGVEMPFFQWGGARAEVQAARAEEARARSRARARREALEEEARFAALQLTQTGRVLAISAKADTVAAKRFEVAKNRYVIGKIGIGDLYIAQNEKDQAVVAYVQALRAYWTAYYRLRRVTLFDFEEGRKLQ